MLTHKGRHGLLLKISFLADEDSEQAYAGHEAPDADQCEQHFRGPIKHRMGLSTQVGPAPEANLVAWQTEERGQKDRGTAKEQGHCAGSVWLYLFHKCHATQLTSRVRRAGPLTYESTAGVIRRRLLANVSNQPQCSSLSNFRVLRLYVSLLKWTK